MTQCEIAKMLGVSQSYVANKLRLLNFSEEVQSEIISAGLTERHARAILKLKGDDAQREAIRKICAMHLSVAASEVLIDDTLFTEMTERALDGEGECISQFESVVCEAVKKLLSKGIRARQSVEYCGNKKYITVMIEDNKQKFY
jgi:ParB-like chromosome segregation protein Spo0J